MATHPSMNDFFQRLDKWRHFPAFPLEPRSEVLFAPFLPTVLEKSKCVGVKVKPLIIPQFPLKHEDSNQSDKVDFFVLSECGKRAFLIELKTDMASISEGQECYLKRAAKKSMTEVLEDLKKIVQATTQKQKYYHLLEALSELCLIQLGDVKSKIYPKVVSGVSKLIDDICILETPSKLEVVYIQPRPCEEKNVEGFKYIYFYELADIVEKQGDMGGLFAGYLRKWIDDPAKSPPRKA